MSFSDKNDPHLKLFTKSLYAKMLAYDEHGNGQVAFVKSQKEQVKSLNALEKKFRTRLVKLAEGKRCYELFVEYIRDDQKNILDARPFFRERQGVFTKYIAKALKNRTPEKIHRFNFNFQFIAFCMKNGVKDKELVKIFNEIKAVRNKLIEVNAPLAIARASQFYRKMPKSRGLTRMDLIQTALECLTSGIDKYTGKYDSNTYRHTLIGRCSGNMIEQASQTMIHFYPTDKRKLYNANKALKHCDASDNYLQISGRINELAKDWQYTTTPDEVYHLITATSTVTSDTTANPTTGTLLQDSLQFADAECNRPDNRAEKVELHTKMYEAINTLTVFERKVLRLKGLDL